MGQLKKTNIYITGNRPPMENVVFGSPLTVTTEITDSEENKKHTWYKLTTPNPSSGNIFSYRSAKIEFTTTEDNIEVEFKIKAQTNWDGNVIIGALDYYNTNGVIDADYIIAEIYGNWVEKIIKYQVPTKGKHFIQFQYAKSSNNSGDGAYICAWSNLNMPISEVKSVYVENSKIQQMNVQGKDLFEYKEYGNTISWDTLKWNKSTGIYTYNTNEPIKFTYYIGNAYTDVVLQGSPKPLPINDFDGVYFRDVITHIGTSYTKLYKLDLSDWDTSNVTNMRNIFARCSSLSYLNISGFDTSNVTSMTNMFLLCEKLPSLDVSHFNTSNVKEMDFMFYNLNIDSLDVSRFNTSKVTNMNCMFYGCRKLTYLDVSHFNTNNVLTMNNMFNYCRLLKSLNVSNFNTSNVTTMEGMFQNCESLVSLDLSNFDTSKVTNMDSMFKFCNSLKTLNVSNFDTSKVTKMNYMFNNCTSLIGLDLTKWTMNTNVSIGVIFYNCKELTTLIDGHESEPNVTIMNGLNKPIELDSSPKLNYESVYALFRGVANVTTTKTITLPKVMEGNLDSAKVKIATDKGWTITYK